MIVFSKDETWSADLVDIQAFFSFNKGFKYILTVTDVRGVINKFVSFFHRIIIYGWIYIIFCHYHHESIVNRKKTLNRPNHCGRHLGKINGHKSIYVLTWRCIQDEFDVIFMQPCLNKLLQSQAEVCVFVVSAKQVYQSSA